MNTMPTDPDYAQPLYTLAEQVLSLCRQSGADQAEVSLSQDTGFAANVRLGEVETVERTNDQGVAVTVYVNQRKGTASTAGPGRGYDRATRAGRHRDRTAGTAVGAPFIGQTGPAVTAVAARGAAAGDMGAEMGADAELDAAAAEAGAEPPAAALGRAKR